MKAPETFTERMAPVRRFDAALYFASGAEIYGVAVEPVIYRLRFDKKEMAVDWEPLAFFYARIIAHETGPSSTIAVIAGHNRNCTPFLFRCPLVWLTGGKGTDAKKFLRAFYSTPGTVPSYVRPGKLAATLRAIVTLSELGEPMPKVADETVQFDS